MNRLFRTLFIIVLLGWTLNCVLEHLVVALPRDETQWQRILHLIDDVVLYLALVALVWSGRRSL